MEKYRIICKNCSAERQVQIMSTAIGKRIDWMESAKNATHPIVSGRERLDGQWGWQCTCGNDDLLTTQEKRTFSDHTSPKPQEINQIIKNMKPDKPKFEMVAV